MLVSEDIRLSPDEEELPVAAPNTLPNTLPRSLCALMEPEHIMATETAISLKRFFFIVSFEFKSVQRYNFSVEHGKYFQ
jgi:hypothetical protein